MTNEPLKTGQMGKMWKESGGLEVKGRRLLKGELAQANVEKATRAHFMQYGSKSNSEV